MVDFPMFIYFTGMGADGPFFCYFVNPRVFQKRFLHWYNPNRVLLFYRLVVFSSVVVKSADFSFFEEGRFFSLFPATPRFFPLIASLFYWYAVDRLLLV